MTKLLAIAFHESVSVAKLAQLFTSELNQLFAGTTAAHCRVCGMQFAVFFPASDDPENGKYLADIEKLIQQDCEHGAHHEEISLTFG